MQCLQVVGGRIYNTSTRAALLAAACMVLCWLNVKVYSQQVAFTSLVWVFLSWLNPGTRIRREALTCSDLPKSNRSPTT